MARDALPVMLNDDLLRLLDAWRGGRTRAVAFRELAWLGMDCPPGPGASLVYAPEVIDLGPGPVVVVDVSLSPRIDALLDDYVARFAGERPDRSTALRSALYDGLDHYS